MTMARLLLLHSDSLVGYKYCNGIDNNRLEDDILVVRRRSANYWISQLRIPICGLPVLLIPIHMQFSFF